MFINIMYLMDLFEKIKKNRGPLGQHAKNAHGYFTFPKLEGEIASRMKFNKKEVAELKLKSPQVMLCSVALRTSRNSWTRLPDVNL